MYDIPTEKKWIVWGRNTDGKTIALNRCDDKKDADAVAQRMKKDRSDLEVEIEAYDAIVPDRTLPTPKQIEEICWILHGALVIIRNLGHADDKVNTMREIAEVLHETPLEMFNPNTWDWNSTLARLRELEKNYPDSRTYGMARRFEEIYRNA